MADVEPPTAPPEPHAIHAGGLFVGILVGIAIAFLTSIAAFMGASVAEGSCSGSVVVLAVGLIATALLGWATWHTFFGRRDGGFVVYALRGLLATVFLWTIVPWPCSAGWIGAYVLAGACRGH
jgi:hypothetical protein